MIESFVSKGRMQHRCELQSLVIQRWGRNLSFRPLRLRTQRSGIVEQKVAVWRCRDASQDIVRQCGSPISGA